MISTIAKFADIGLFKDDEPGNISKEIFLYKVIIDKGVHDTIPNVANCDRAKNVGLLSFDGHQL